MNDRNHYKRFASTLCEELPAQVRNLKLPSSWTVCPQANQSVLLDRKRFQGVALVVKSVNDADNIKTFREKRLKKLDRLLQSDVLLHIFNPSEMLSGLCDHEKYKSIHTVFSRLSDVHLLV